MNIRAIIAEDEPLARNKLVTLLTEESDVQVVATCANANQTVEAVLAHRPDLLFLDVEMPGGTGFSVLEALEPDRRPAVIFTTAFDHYAVRAFEAYALDYLLKPFDQERLQKAVTRARLQLQRGDGRERVGQMLKDPRVSHTSKDRLIIKSGGRVLFLNVGEIDWIEASANYVKIHTGKDNHLFRETMYGMERRLDPQRFARIHRSIIANLVKIKELRTCNSGEFIVTMHDGKELPGSRNYRSAILPFLKKTG